MAKQPYVEKLDQAIFDAVIKLTGVVTSQLPTSAQLQSVIRLSFELLTPEQKKIIVEQAGPEWYLALAARIEKELHLVDKVVQ